MGRSEAEGAMDGARDSRDELFRLMVECATDYAIFVCDPDGLALTWSAGAERLLQWSAAEMLGRSCDVIFSPTDREAGAPALERGLALRVGRAEDERWHFRKDGSRLWAAGIMFPVRDEDGVHVGFAKILRDFTRRRELQLATIKQERMESVGVLAGGIAHQFNNLLTAVLGNLELLSRRAGVRLDPDARQMADSAVQAAGRAAELTRQLLEYAGKSRTEVRPFDLCTELGSVAALLRARLPTRIELTVELPEACPPVVGDSAQLRQLLTQLLLNAAEALGSAAGRVTARVRSETLTAAAARDDYPDFALRPGRYVRLEVSDSGPGMDAATLGRIFEPFFSTKFQGRGLGLAAVLGIVRGHGGAIGATSAPGEGTTLGVLLPAADGGEAEPAGGTGGERVAIVCDDEELIRDLVTAVLEEEGFVVVQAENGVQAIRTMERLRDTVAVVVLDVAMPVMDGEETLPLLRQIRGDVPIVLMTGLGDFALHERLEPDGVEAFLPKPFSVERLSEAVARALARS